MPHALLYVLIALLASCTFGAGASAKEAPEKLWSFVAPKAPAVPHVADADWAQHDIDRFILAKLEAADLKPTTDADKYTLLRRATFDLIGLPPTAKELEAFVKDPSPDAFGKAVDRLLASPHFGERWGRHWLDVARFAESTGGGRSLMFPNAWRYRDYVIGAYNADKPFDQFVREQLAGDLLEHASNSQRAEQLTATAFLMLGPHNYEQQDKAYLRMDVIDEQIGTTSKAFLGLSLDCARCHDHKSDPMSIEDYYAMAGIFGSTNMITPGNVSGWTETPLEAPQVMAAYEAHAKKLADLTKENKKLTTQRDKLIGANDQTAAVKLASLAGIVRDSDEAILTGAFKPSSSVKPFVGVDYLHTSSVNASAQWVIAIADTGKYEVRVSYTAHNNRAKRAIATVHSTEGSRTIEFDQTQRPPIDGLFVSLGVFEFADEARVELGLAEESGALIVDAVQLLRVGADAGTTPKQKRANKLKGAEQHSQQVADLNQRIDVLAKQIAQLKKKTPAKPNMTMALVEADEPSDEPLHVQGQVRNLGAPVPRGSIEAMTPGGDGRFDIAAGHSGRLELADWMTDTQNPLTARVYVNRVWGHLMGVGLVNTPDNFGYTGSAPTHPKLLDYLATELMANGWSTKQLIGAIMRSRTYGLATSPSGQTVDEVDPDNTLLSYAHRRRLEAEPIRDAMLAIAGELDTTAGGLTIRKVETYDLTYQFKTKRRSVYVPAFRASVLELFEVFDAATPNVVTGQRPTSTLPTQALYMMNAPFVIEQAEAAATKLLGETSGAGAEATHEARVELAYLRTLGRRPSAAERRQAMGYLTSSPPTTAAVILDDGGIISEDSSAMIEAYSALFHALFASTDFRYLN